MIIDLSKWNTVRDWNLVKTSVDGIIIRCGYRGYGSGKIVEDAKFKEFANACRANKIPFGLYFMSQAISISEAVEEAEYTVGKARQYGATLPLYIDSEDGDGTARVVRADALLKSERTAICKVFCQTVKNSGYTPGIYASKSWFESKLDVNQLTAYRLWVAQYSKSLTAKHRVDMWQYTSSGEVPGISGRVDCSREIVTPVSNNPFKEPLVTIKNGSRGDGAKWVQWELNRHGASLVVDGIFGTKSVTALKLFQERSGLVVDGLCGVKTRKALKV